MKLELFCIDIIEGKRRLPLVKGGLYLLSFLFRLGVAIRAILYRLKAVRGWKFACPVISIGNLVAGGTGKTPFAQALAEEIFPVPGEVAILCRGYRSLQQKKKDSLLLSKGFGPVVSPEYCGDESYWLASHTSALVIVGRDRKQSGFLALANGAKLLILEDGFQHRQIERNIDIVLLDGSDLFGKGYFLPRGYLRESPSRLKEADFIVVTHVDKALNRSEVEREIRRYTKAPIVGFAMTTHLDPRIPYPKVGAFCGIAKPDHFYGALISLGQEVIEVLTSPDHQLPSVAELRSFATKCREQGACCLVCTEKDYVKIKDVGGFDLPVYPLKMSLTCVWNENVWKEMKRSIKNSDKL